MLIRGAEDDAVDNPSIWNPTPTNIVDEYIEEGNSEVKYDPIYNKATLGTGDEDDAKKSGEHTSMGPIKTSQTTKGFSKQLKH